MAHGVAKTGVASTPPPAWAWELSRDCLAGMPDRWRHSVRAAIKASRWPCLFDQEAQTVLQTAVILHDIGYSPDNVRSGFHALAALTGNDRILGCDPGPLGPSLALVRGSRCPHRGLQRMRRRICKDGPGLSQSRRQRSPEVWSGTIRWMWAEFIQRRMRYTLVQGPDRGRVVS